MRNPSLLIEAYRWTRDIAAPRLLVALFAKRAPWLFRPWFYLFDEQGNRR
jgi:hypothetical protein